MKYEEWVKYEEARKNQPAELAWMVWVEYPANERSLDATLSLAEQEKYSTNLWSMIVQYLNSKRI